MRAHGISPFIHVSINCDVDYKMSHCMLSLVFTKECEENTNFFVIFYLKDIVKMYCLILLLLSANLRRLSRVG